MKSNTHDRSREAQFWHLLVGTWLIMLIIAAVFNLFIDPFRIYGTDIFPRADVNLHEVKLEFLRDYQPPGEALIIGNSRALTLDPELVEDLTGQRCFNFSLPGAKTETFYSMIKIALDDYDWPIETVIVSIALGCFHPTLPIEMESRFVDRIAENYIYHENARATWLDRIALLFTFDQIKQASIVLLRSIIATPNQHRIEYREDGYIYWHARESNFTEGKIDIDDVLDKRIPQYPGRVGLNEFDEISLIRMKYWEDLISICDEHGIKLYVYMSPIHPRLQDFLRENDTYELFNMVSDYVAGSVVDNHAEFLDLRDIDVFGGDPQGFYDEVHLRPCNADAIIRYLLSTERESVIVRDR